MSITAKELAKRLELSEAAISMALNNKPGVSQKTRQRVLDAAQKFGYDFSKRLIYSLDQRKGTICLVVYKRSGAVVADTSFFSALFESVSVTCKQQNYNLSIQYFYEHDDAGRMIDSLKSSGYAGVILLATEMQADKVSIFSDVQIPFVILDSYFDRFHYDCVLINNIQGAFSAATHLISQFRVQPGYLRSSYPINNFEERADGFYKAIRAHGMSTSQSVVHHLTPSQEGAYADMAEIIRSGEALARAYFADNDLIAVGAMKAFQEVGYRIPEDIALIGFDDQPICQYVTPSLSTIRVRPENMGEAAVLRLLQILEGKSSYSVKLEVTTLLVKRRSTAAGESARKVLI